MLNLQDHPPPRTNTDTALHYLEYVSLFGKSKGSSSSSFSSASVDEAQEQDEQEDAHSLLDGTWRLAFNSGGAFPFKGARQDRWGYLKDDVEVNACVHRVGSGRIRVDLVWW